MTEVCAFVSVAEITKGLSAILPNITDNLPDITDTDNFTIDCNGSECKNATDLLISNCQIANSKIKCSQQ